MIESDAWRMSTKLALTDLVNPCALMSPSSPSAHIHAVKLNCQSDAFDTSPSDTGVSLNDNGSTGTTLVSGSASMLVCAKLVAAKMAPIAAHSAAIPECRHIGMKHTLPDSTPICAALRSGVCFNVDAAATSRRLTSNLPHADRGSSRPPGALICSVERSRNSRAAAVEAFPEPAADESTTGPAYLMLTAPEGNPILIDQHVPSSAKRK